MLEVSLATVDLDVKDDGDGVPPYYPGVWLNFTGTGRRVAAKACAKDTSYTEISIFTGGCDPSVRQLVAAINDGCGPIPLIFETTLGMAYHVLVQAAVGPRTRVDVSIFSAPLAPANDLCINAQPITIGPSPTPAQFNITYATADLEVESVCPNPYPAEYRGIWFNFTGTGRRIVARACEQIYGGYTMISIFTGGCNPSDLQCIANAVNGCNDEIFIFETTLGTQYHALVQLSGNERRESRVDVSFFSAAPAPANDLCIDAQSITIGSSAVRTNFNITYATADLEVADDCLNGGPAENRGVWLNFTGTGSRVEGLACVLGGYNAAYISIFTDGCNTLKRQCVAATYNSCQTGIFVFETTLGTVYHALVQVGTQTFDSNVDVSFFAAPPVTANDLCIDAQSITIGSSAVRTNFNTTYATTDSEVADDCLNGGPAENRGVWYNFTGTGRSIVVRACTLTKSRPHVSIFTGGCNPLARQCVAGTDDGCRFEKFIVETKLGTAYHVLVQTPWENHGADLIGELTIFNGPVPAPIPVPVPAPVPVPVPAPVPAPAKAPTGILVPVSGSCTAQVTGYILVDAKRATDIMPLRSYTMNGMPDLLSIRADVLECSPNVTESVYFDFDGVTRCESFSPYSVFGDFSTEDRSINETAYRGKAISAGRHIIKATPYTSDSCRGTAGKTLSLDFTVVNGTINESGCKETDAGFLDCDQPTAAPNVTCDSVNEVTSFNLVDTESPYRPVVIPFTPPVIDLSKFPTARLA